MPALDKSHAGAEQAHAGERAHHGGDGRVGDPKSLAAHFAWLIELSQMHAAWPEKSDSAIIGSRSVKSPKKRDCGQ